MKIKNLLVITLVQLFLSVSAQGSSAIPVFSCEWGDGADRLSMVLGLSDIYESEGIEMPFDQNVGNILYLNGQSYVPVSRYFRAWTDEEFRMSVDHRAFSGSGHSISAVFYTVEEAKEHARLVKEHTGSGVRAYKYEVKAPLILVVSGDSGYVSNGEGVTLLPFYSCEWHSSITN